MSKSPAGILVIDEAPLKVLSKEVGSGLLLNKPTGIAVKDEAPWKVPVNARPGNDFVSWLFYHLIMPQNI